jgi:hypothetical protein
MQFVASSCAGRRTPRATQPQRLAMRIRCFPSHPDSIAALRNNRFGSGPVAGCLAIVAVPKTVAPYLTGTCLRTETSIGVPASRSIVCSRRATSAPSFLAYDMKTLRVPNSLADIEARFYRIQCNLRRAAQLHRQGKNYVMIETDWHPEKQSRPPHLDRQKTAVTCTSQNLNRASMLLR